MVDTRQALLDSATELVRTRGYNGFSYADLSERVGIRKASIHHHFPTKEDLGVAIVDRYIEHFASALGQIAAEPTDATAKLHRYVGLYRDSLANSQGCLCGMLASEVDVVPPTVASGVRRFMDCNIEWLGRVLSEGQAQGTIAASAPAAAMAITVLTACQGALIVARSMQSTSCFDSAINNVFAVLHSSG